MLGNTTEFQRGLRLAAGARAPAGTTGYRSHLRASPAVSPPRQPFRSRTSRYPPPPAAQSSSASPSAPHRPACRVSAAYPGAPARGSASRRDGSCGRPRRFALLFLCPASAGKRATAPVQPLSPMPNSVAVPSDTPANGWPSFALRKWAARTQSRVHCQNAGQCTALHHGGKVRAHIFNRRRKRQKIDSRRRALAA